ncbi:MAG: aspartate/glutamate racemase family protein [Spirochaetia bacterium]
MAITVYCVHSITGLEATFSTLIHEEIPGEVKVHHISDESLIRRILARGKMTKDVRRRFFENVTAAEQAGADVIQVTCSSLTPAVACARELVDIPLFSVDEPMARRAVEGYKTIGVMATNPGTLNPSSDLLRSIAADEGKRVEIKPVLCEGAYEALLGGDRTRHDEIVRGYFRDLEKKVDVVVLAQASMAKIIDSLDERDSATEVLTSPRLAIKQLAEYLSSSTVDAG